MSNNTYKIVMIDNEYTMISIIIIIISSSSSFIILISNRSRVRTNYMIYSNHRN